MQRCRTREVGWIHARSLTRSRDRLLKLVSELPNEITRRTGLLVSTVNLFRFSKLLTDEGHDDIDPTVVQIYMLYSNGASDLPLVRQESPERLYNCVKTLMKEKQFQCRNRSSRTVGVKDAVAALNLAWGPEYDLNEFSTPVVADHLPGPCTLKSDWCLRGQTYCRGKHTPGATDSATPRDGSKAAAGKRSALSRFRGKVFKMTALRTAGLTKGRRSSTPSIIYEGAQLRGPCPDTPNDPVNQDSTENTLLQDTVGESTEPPSLPSSLPSEDQCSTPDTLQGPSEQTPPSPRDPNELGPTADIEHSTGLHPSTDLQDGSLTPSQDPAAESERGGDGTVCEAAEGQGSTGEERYVGDPQETLPTASTSAADADVSSTAPVSPSQALKAATGPPKPARQSGKQAVTSAKASPKTSKLSRDPSKASTTSLDSNSASSRSQSSSSKPSPQSLLRNAVNRVATAKKFMTRLAADQAKKAGNAATKGSGSNEKSAASARATPDKNSAAKVEAPGVKSRRSLSTTDIIASVAKSEAALANSKPPPLSSTASRKSLPADMMKGRKSQAWHGGTAKPPADPFNREDWTRKPVARRRLNLGDAQAAASGISSKTATGSEAAHIHDAPATGKLGVAEGGEINAASRNGPLDCNTEGTAYALKPPVTNSLISGAHSPHPPSTSKAASGRGFTPPSDYSLHTDSPLHGELTNDAEAGQDGHTDFCSGHADMWDSEWNLYSSSDGKVLEDLINRCNLQEPFHVYAAERFKSWEPSVKTALREVADIDHFCDDGYLYDTDEDLVADIVDLYDPGPFGTFFPPDLLLQTSDSFMPVAFDSATHGGMKVAHRTYGGWFEPQVMVVLRSRNALHRDVGWRLSAGCDRRMSVECKSPKEEVRRVEAPVDKEDAYLDVTSPGSPLRDPLWYYIYRTSGVSVGTGMSPLTFTKALCAFEFSKHSPQSSADTLGPAIELKVTGVAESLLPCVPLSASGPPSELLRMSIQAEYATTSEDSSLAAMDALGVFQAAYANFLVCLDGIFMGDKIRRVALFTKTRKRMFGAMVTYVCVNILVILLSAVSMTLMATRSQDVVVARSSVTSYPLLWNFFKFFKWRPGGSQQ
ncbi:uncharacterized protein BcabD6B2_20530 [Babesia caballi]|uniref:Uncharacterized protein n=1 Tax=Babesia caballi TaxID=5871 RepID=A0AAV4LRN3_BABCB|nr:hypothetical protein, conserved [Babesia caballi]